MPNLEDLKAVDGSQIPYQYDYRCLQYSNITQDIEDGDSVDLDLMTTV